MLKCLNINNTVFFNFALNLILSIIDLSDIIEKEREEIKSVKSWIKDTRRLTHNIQASLASLSEIIMKYNSSEIVCDYEVYVLFLTIIKI